VKKTVKQLQIFCKKTGKKFLDFLSLLHKKATRYRVTAFGLLGNRRASQMGILKNKLKLFRQESKDSSNYNHSHLPISKFLKTSRHLVTTLKSLSDKRVKKISKLGGRFNKRRFNSLPKNRRILTVILCLVTVSCLSFVMFREAPTEAGWLDEGWHFRRKLTIDNASSSENLTNFPILVSLNSSRIDYDNTKSSGEDLRFTDPDGVILSHEIESWNESGTSTVWVKIPQIDAQSIIDHIYVYYGNPDATDVQDTENVWDSNFKMVQHMAETADPYADSTANDHDSLGSTDPDQVSGQIGYGQNFDFSASEFIVVPDHADLDFGITDNFTIELNLKTDATGTTKRLIDKVIATNQEGYAMQIRNDNGHIECIIEQEDGTHSEIEGGTDVTTGSWYHAVFVRDVDSDVLRLYVNGVSDATAVIDTITATLANSLDLWIGKKRGTFPVYFDGTIDEVRISNTARSAEWIEANYLSMTDDMLTYASAEKQPKPVGVWRFDEGQGGTIYDDSNYDNDGTIPTSTISHWATSTSAKYGNAIDFDGTNDYVTISDSTSTSVTGDLSISAWVRPDAVSATSTIVGKWDETTGSQKMSYRLFVDVSNRLSLSLSSNGTSTAATVYETTGSLTSAGTWYHVEATYNDSNQAVKLYVNAVEQATSTTGTVPSSISDNASNLYIGAKENSSGSIDTKFNGVIDDIRIYNYARSASQVLIDYNGGFSTWLGE